MLVDCRCQENAEKSKPNTNKKENPYAADGKKQCTICKEVKLFKEFGSDKTRPDGYGHRCKECRRKKANAYYQSKEKPMLTIDCDFCEEKHEITQAAYDANIANNGHYICRCQSGTINMKKLKENQDFGITIDPNLFN